jgi:hypothetical protein
MLVQKAHPLMRKAADGSVGARKEVFLALEAANGFCWYAGMQSTKEGVVVVQEATNRIWGSDCKMLMKIVTGQAFDRHHLVWRSVGVRICTFVT